MKFKVAAALHEDYRQMDQIFFKEIQVLINVRISRPVILSLFTLTQLQCSTRVLQSIQQSPFFIRLRPNIRDCGDVLLYYYLRCCLDVIAIFIFAQTNYCIPREEVEVYKLLGDHEHIVKHYGGTFRESEGKASIFMEKCGMLFFEWWHSLLVVNILAFPQQTFEEENSITIFEKGLF